MSGFAGQWLGGMRDADLMPFGAVVESADADPAGGDVQILQIPAKPGQCRATEATFEDAELDAQTVCLDNFGDVVALPILGHIVTNEVSGVPWHGR